MNRPFYAFGVLLAFLALGMLAVGLSSRPMHQQPSAGGAGSGIPSPRPQIGGIVFVLNLREGEKLARLGRTIDDVGTDVEIDSVAGKAIYQGSGLNWRTRYFHSLCTPLQAAHSAIGSPAILVPRSIPIQPVAVQLAADPSMLTATESIDCRSHYDAVYDREMSGDTSQPCRTICKAPADEPSEPMVPEQDEEMLVLFQSILANRPGHLQDDVETTPSQGRRWDYEARAILGGAMNRVWWGLEAVHLDDDWMRAAVESGCNVDVGTSKPGNPFWLDYEDWFGSQQPTVAAQDNPPGGKAGNWQHGRDQVLQFAVAALNRVAELLHESVRQWAEEAADEVAQRIGIAAQAALPK